MAKYLKLFERHSDYETYINGNDAILPNVSVCEDEHNVVHYNPFIPQRDYSKEYLTTEALEDNSTITFRIGQEVTTNCLQSVSYSTNGGVTWVTTNNTDGKSADLNISVIANTGDVILWKGTGIKTIADNMMEGVNAFWSDIMSNRKFNVYGNIMSLLYGDNFSDQVTFPSGSQDNFKKMFYQSSNLVDASNLILPATTLTANCYNQMFYGCSSLTTAPELPATTLATDCYYHMFEGCTSLTQAPSILPATTLASSCYASMFYGCTSLTTAPELPATTLTTSCYQSMFYGCSSLNYIKAMFTTEPNPYYINDWVNGVAATGTFVKNSAATWTATGTYAIPTGWSVETADA